MEKKMVFVWVSSYFKRVKKNSLI